MKKRKNALSASLIGAGPKKKQDQETNSGGEDHVIPPHLREDSGEAEGFCEDGMCHSDRSGGSDGNSGRANGFMTSRYDMEADRVAGAGKNARVKNEHGSKSRSAHIATNINNCITPSSSLASSSAAATAAEALSSLASSSHRAPSSSLLAAAASTMITPQINDVLIGKGPNIFHHVGNRRFRVLVELHISSYFDESNLHQEGNSNSNNSDEDKVVLMLNAPPTAGQLDIIKGVIKSIEGNVPPGRFLIQEVIDGGSCQEGIHADGSANSSNPNIASSNPTSNTKWRLATPTETVSKVQTTFVAAGRFLVKKAGEEAAVAMSGIMASSSPTSQSMARVDSAMSLQSREKNEAAASHPSNPLSVLGHGSATAVMSPSSATMTDAAAQYAAAGLTSVLPSDDNPHKMKHRQNSSYGNYNSAGGNGANSLFPNTNPMEEEELRDRNTANTILPMETQSSLSNIASVKGSYYFTKHDTNPKHHHKSQQHRQSQNKPRFIVSTVGGVPHPMSRSTTSSGSSSPNPTELSASPHPPVDNMEHMHIEEQRENGESLLAELSAAATTTNPSKSKTKTKLKPSPSSPFKKRTSLSIAAPNTAGNIISIRCPPKLKEFCNQPFERFFVMDEEQPDNCGLTFLPSSYITPSNYDVLCGAGQAYFHHVGNRRFRIMIEMNVHSYEKCFLTLAGADANGGDGGADGEIDAMETSPTISSSSVSAAKSQIRELIEETCQSISTCDPPGRFLGMDFATGRWRVLNPTFAKLKTEQTFFECMRVKLLQAKKLAEMESARIARQEEVLANLSNNASRLEGIDLDGSHRSASNDNTCSVCPAYASLQAIQNDPELSSLQSQARELLGRRNCIPSTGPSAADEPPEIEPGSTLAMSEIMRKFAQEQSAASRALLRKIHTVFPIKNNERGSVFALRNPLQERRSSLPSRSSALNNSSHHSNGNDSEDCLNSSQLSQNCERRDSDSSYDSDAIRETVSRIEKKQSGGEGLLNSSHDNELMDVVGGMIMMSRRSSM